MFSFFRRAKVVKDIFLVKIDKILAKLDTILSQQQQLQEELQDLRELISQRQLDSLSKEISVDSPKLGVAEMPKENYHTMFANDFAKYIATFEGKKVLVVGCGKGEDCSFFIDFGADTVHGLDITDHIGCNFQHPKVSYFQCSAEEMEFEDCSYDYVYSIAVMEHIHQIDKAFSEMVRVARLGGMIYCVASPLWNSRNGHHEPSGVFNHYPWIHLRLTKQEILEYCQRKRITHIYGTHVYGDLTYPPVNIEDGLEFMFSNYFNFLPAHRYLDVCNQLPVSQIIQNNLLLEADDLLPEDLFLELEALGYSRQELLAVSHTFVARK